MRKLLGRSGILTERAAAPARDLVGRNVIVTGGSGGIGRVTVGALARRGARVWMACRAQEGAARAMTALDAGPGCPALEIEFLPLDLADLSSVRAAAASFLARGLPLHVLVNNAGRAGPGGLTRDGFELTFAVNHLGHFLLTRLLEPALRAGSPARVINLSSESHRPVRRLDFAAFRRPTASASGLREYGASKLCNVLFTRELARRWAGTGITAYAVHPGVVATDIWRRVPQPARWLMTRFMIGPEKGARTTITCATAAELAGSSGRYYQRERESEPSAIAQDDALAARLWDESERLAGGT